ncbi:hypothetical protein E8E13_004528 [Curvularia kusanoi]|uniref:Uncharacterized protein n=1 Tax=Curvularia kusanoi TaxID=90978 RepID=A0A9P4TKX9_CURKU|nr:hypothetical protein E8E13_004528 [Curvularia kusanoi]
MLVAEQHHSRAITGLMESLSDENDPASGNAIFANAVLTFFYAFISFGPMYNEERTGDNAAAHTSRILGASWVPLIRGLDPIVARVYEQVTAGPLGSLLDIGKWMDLQPGTEEDPDDTLIDRTREIWTTGNYSKEDKDVYDEALRALRQCNMWLKTSHGWHDDEGPRKANYGPWSGPFIWVSIVPLAFFSLLEQRQVPAMIIFANFGALLHRLNHLWYMEGCGKSIVEVVDQCLGPYWGEWLDWAKTATKPENT